MGRLRTARPRRIADGHAKKGIRGPDGAPPDGTVWRTTKPLMAKSSTTDGTPPPSSRPADLEAERSGIVRAAALNGPLGTAFTAAVELIQGQGPRHRHRVGQIRPRGAQDRRHAGLHRHAGVFRACGGGRPRRSRHDTGDDVIVALSWSGEQPEMRNLVNYASRFAIPMIAVTSNAASSLGAAARMGWNCRKRAKPARTIWRRPPPR